jgi:hypothetical protein
MENLYESLKREICDNVIHENHEKETHSIQDEDDGDGDHHQQQSTTANETLQDKPDRQSEETMRDQFRAIDKIRIAEDQIKIIQVPGVDATPLTGNEQIEMTDDINKISQGSHRHEATTQDLIADQNDVPISHTSFGCHQVAQHDHIVMGTSLIQEPDDAEKESKAQTHRQECELTVLRSDRVKLLRQIEQQRTLLWEIEESRHYYCQKCIKLSELANRNDLDEKVLDMAIKHSKLVSKIESLQQQNRSLKSLNKSMCVEIYQKNDVICQMSRLCSAKDVSGCFKDEQERSLNMATELSVEYAECQMQNDVLTERLQRLKAEHAHIMDVLDIESPFRNKYNPSQLPYTPRVDRIKSLSSIVSKGLNASFNRLNTPCDSSQYDTKILKVDSKLVKLPSIDLTFTCGNTSGIKIGTVCSASKKSTIPKESSTSTSKEKLQVTEVVRSHDQGSKLRSPVVEDNAGAITGVPLSPESTNCAIKTLQVHDGPSIISI